MAQRKYGQFAIKVWFVDGGSWEAATTHDLSHAEHARHLLMYAEQLISFAKEAEFRANNVEGGR